SQPVRTSMLSAGTVMIDDTTTPTSETVSLDSELVLGLFNPLDTGIHRMRVRSFGLRDIYNSPFDTLHYLAFDVTKDSSADKFYIVSWTFETSGLATRIHVVFNEHPAD